MFLLFLMKNTGFFLMSIFFSLFYYFPLFSSKTQRERLENLFSGILRVLSISYLLR